MDESLVTVLITVCSLITSVAAASAVITKVVTKTVKKISSETIKEELSNSHQVTEESFDKLNSEIKSLNEKLTEFTQEQKGTNEQLKQTLLANTRDRINQAHDYYCRKKYIGAHSLFVIEELYSSYTSLGGNSFITRQMEDIRALEVRSAETISGENKS